MEDLFERVTSHVALGIEAASVIVISYGALEALVRLIRSTAMRSIGLGEHKDTWRRFAVWLVLGLEFTIAADILRTAIAPTWNDIGQLGAIAVIRTFLNYFLEKDIEKESLAGRKVTTSEAIA